MSKIFTDVTSGWKILWSWSSEPNKVCSGQSEAAGRGKGGSLQTSTDLFCIATKFRGREGLAWRAQRGADERTCSALLLKQLVKATQPVTSLFQVHLLSASNNNFLKQYLLLGKEYSGLREGENINILFFGFSKHNFFA